MPERVAAHFNDGDVIQREGELVILRRPSELPDSGC